MPAAGAAGRAPDAPRRGQPGGQVRRAARTRRVPLRRPRSSRPDALLPDAACRLAARPAHARVARRSDAPRRDRPRSAPPRSCCCRCCRPAIGRTPVVARSAADGALARDGLLLADVHPGVAVRLLHAGVRDRASDAWSTGGGLAWPVVAGLAAGLAVATKETVGHRAARGARRVRRSRGGRSDRTARAIAPTDRSWSTGGCSRASPSAAAVAALFYSSFFTAPARLLEPFRGAGTYLDRGIEPASHAHPWHYYLGLLAYSASGGLAWSEGLVLVLPALGAVTCVAPERIDVEPSRLAASGRAISPATRHRRRRSSPRFRYKTPWNLLPFYAGAFVARRHRIRGARARQPIAAWCAPRWQPPWRSASLHLGWQAWRASVTYAADPRNPYVYAQTVPDAVRMAARIRDLAALQPDGARHAGLGDRAAVRAVAAAVVPARHAERRLLDGSRRRAGAAGAGHRLFDRITRPRSMPRSAIATCRSIYGLRPELLLRSTSSADCGIAFWRSACRDAHRCADGDHAPQPRRRGIRGPLQTWPGHGRPGQ